MESDLEQQPVAAKGVDCLSTVDSRFSTTQTLCLSSASYTVRNCGELSRWGEAASFLIKTPDREKRLLNDVLPDPKNAGSDLAEGSLLLRALLADKVR
jgi:hypothetical protein